MKRYCKNFVFTKEFIKEQMVKCLNNKTGRTVRWKRKDTAHFFAEYMIEAGLDYEENIKKIENVISEDLNKDTYPTYIDALIDYISSKLLEEIEEEKIVLQEIKVIERVDTSCNKVRTIGITSIKQQIYDYIAIAACKEMLEAKIGKYQCSSIKGRGQLYAKKHIEKCIQKKYKKARYASKFDIRKYYQSIEHERIKALLDRDIKNDQVKYLIFTLIDTYGENGKGLCIGTYLSQYMANYYLSYAYHYIQESVFVIRKAKTGEKRVRLVNYAIFYMDDILLLGSNKKYVKMATKMTINYLESELGLKLKNDNYQIIDLFKKNAFVDMVGYKFYKDHTEIRKKIYNRLKRTIKEVDAIDDPAVCKRFMSYHGYVKYSDSRKLKRKTNYNKIYQKAKGVLSNEAKSTVHGKTATCEMLSDIGE